MKSDTTYEINCKMFLFHIQVSRVINLLSRRYTKHMKLSKVWVKKNDAARKNGISY